MFVIFSFNYFFFFSGCSNFSHLFPHRVIEATFGQTLQVHMDVNGCAGSLNEVNFELISVLLHFFIYQLTSVSCVFYYPGTFLRTCTMQSLSSILSTRKPSAFAHFPHGNYLHNAI